MGSSIKNKKVDGDCGKAESVQKFLIIYLRGANSKTEINMSKFKNFFFFFLNISMKKTKIKHENTEKNNYL